MKQMRIIGVIVLLLTLARTLLAQEINQDQLIKMRDSLDNLLIINPTNSAIIVRHHELEFFSFNSLLTNSNFNDKEGNSTNFDGKQILFNSILQLNYGVSKNRRVNIGADFNYRAYQYSADKESSAFSVFNGETGTASGFTHAGLRIRVQPFKKIYRLNYQSNIWFPVANQSNQLSLGTDKINWGNTFFYYKYFNNKVGLFTQANFTFAFPGAYSSYNAKTELYIPVSGSISFVANRKNIFFGTLTYSWITTDINKTLEGGDSDYVQATVGYQRILFKDFFLMMNYNATLLSRNYGEWNGFNLGIRYLY